MTKFAKALSLHKIWTFYGSLKCYSKTATASIKHKNDNWRHSNLDDNKTAALICNHCNQKSFLTSFFKIYISFTRLKIPYACQFVGLQIRDQTRHYYVAYLLEATRSYGATTAYTSGFKKGLLLPSHLEKEILTKSNLANSSFKDLQEMAKEITDRVTNVQIILLSPLWEQHRHFWQLWLFWPSFIAITWTMYWSNVHLGSQESVTLMTEGSRCKTFILLIYLRIWTARPMLLWKRLALSSSFQFSLLFFSLLFPSLPISISVNPEFSFPLN